MISPTKTYAVPPGTRLTNVIRLDEGLLTIIHVPLAPGDHIGMFLTHPDTGVFISAEVLAFALDDPITFTRGNVGGKPYIYHLTEAERRANRAACQMQEAA